MSRYIDFGNNLKAYRIKHQLTQKQLAEHIGYTEKSISKWEKGGGLPPLELLLALAKLFRVSLDELVFCKDSAHYFLGIDGGGTKTVFKLVDETGAVVRQVVKGPSNPNDITMKNATALLKDGINEVCDGLSYGNITLFAGLSGGGLTGNNAAVLHRFFEQFGFFAFDNGSDIENLVALSKHDPCVLVIMGTGSVVYALNGNTRKRIAGWGQFFDEGGSGYTLGRDAITAALCHNDGSGEPTALSKLIEEKVGETAEAHLAEFYRKGKRYIASFAALVFEAAEQHDAVALQILENNMAFIAHRIRTAVKTLPASKAACPVLISGGIGSQSKVLFPLINAHLGDVNCQLIRPQQEPVDGAVKRAKEIFQYERTEGHRHDTYV